MSTPITEFAQIDLGAIPEIPGLKLRGFQGESDYAHMLALINAAKRADEIQRSDTLEDIARYYAHLTNCNPYRDMLFVEVDEAVAAYSRVWWGLGEQGKWFGFHLEFTHPAWRDQGLREVIHRFNEARLRQIAAELEAQGEIRADTPRFFEAWASDTEADKAALLEGEGYHPVRYQLDMVRPLSEPIEVTPMPEGLEVRPAPPERYRAVWEADQEAFRDHWHFIPGTEEDYQGWLEWSGFNPSLWKVAWEGEQVAGMVLNFLNEKENAEYNRKRGYTEGISVRRPWRRRGLARSLLTQSLQMFKEMGMEEAALGVDAENLSGALRLYQSVGFSEVKRTTTYHKAL